MFSIRPLKARPLSMKRCLANLMDNALRYGGHVVVDVRDSDDMLSVIISDSGPGIAESELKKVFEPFYRVGTFTQPQHGRNRARPVHCPEHGPHARRRRDAGKQAGRRG